MQLRRTGAGLLLIYVEHNAAASVMCFLRDGTDAIIYFLTVESTPNGIGRRSYFRRSVSFDLNASMVILIISVAIRWISRNVRIHCGVERLNRRFCFYFCNNCTRISLGYDNPQKEHAF